MKVSREQYADYLRSREWAERREKVMQRARGLCEGCRVRPATEVHHLTYEHVTREFLFELVAICGDCHARLHDAPGRPTAPHWTPRQASPSAQAMQEQLNGLAVHARAKFMATQPKPPPPMNERLAALARKYRKAGNVEEDLSKTGKGEAA